MGILTNGNIIVNNIKLGDIHYEFAYDYGIKCKVITLPKNDGNGRWCWKSKNINTHKIIKYYVKENMSHYVPNLYDYEAYSVNRWI